MINSLFPFIKVSAALHFGIVCSGFDLGLALLRQQCRGGDEDCRGWIEVNWIEANLFCIGLDRIGRVGFGEG